MILLELGRVEEFVKLLQVISEGGVMKPKPKNRSIVALQMILKTGGHSGKHKNRSYDFKKGRIRKPKHKEDLRAKY